MILKILFFIVVIFASCTSYNLDFITKCRISDRECTTRSGQVVWPIVANGIEELGIPSSDPLYIKLIESDRVGVKIVFKDVLTTGIKSCSVVDTTTNDKDLKFTFELICNLVFSGKYNISGNVLVIPVTGDGDFKIDLPRNRIKLEGDIVPKTDEKKTYWHIARYTFKNNLEEPVVFHFENLFSGNKQLSDPVHEFVNANYKDVIGELGEPILDVIYKKLMKSANKFFKYLGNDYFIV